MQPMRYAILVIATLASGCGGSQSEMTTNDPVALNVIDAAAKGTPAAVAAATDCGNKPDFVPIYDAGEITTCVSGPDGQPHHVSGNIVYLAKAEPAEVLGWSRTQANASGLVPREAGPSIYSAGEKARRSLVVRVEPVRGGTRVTINWGDEL